MAAKLTIFFQHHKTDEVTRRRLERVERLNPGVPIVLLTYGSADVFPGTLDVKKMPGFAVEDGWYGADLMSYAWHRHGRGPGTEADRYVIVEWDMLYRVPMAEFYREVWEEDVAGAQVYHAGPHHHWDWFLPSLPRLPSGLRPFAAGLTPLAGVLLSNGALRAIAQSDVPPRIYSECRLATLANFHGFDLVELPFAKKRNLTWKQDFVRMDKDTPVYHPLKTLSPLDDE